jgi:predicted helicase
MELVRIEPNEYGDWITTRNVAFPSFYPLASEKKFNPKSEAVFVGDSMGFATNKDVWVYNFLRVSFHKVSENY